MAQTPERPDRGPDCTSRLPLGELTPAPHSSRRLLRGYGPATHLNRADQPALQREGLSLQRFSVVSRRCAPYPKVPVQPGADHLKLPAAFRSSVEFPAVRVKLCSCSWRQRPLNPNKKRLCGQDTDEHDEYRILEAMSRRFRAERVAQGEMADADVAGRGSGIWPGSDTFGFNANVAAKRRISETKVAQLAASQKLDVHFILEPNQEVISGYIAVQKLNEEASVPAELLVHQVYVEPECRKRGYATTALKLILANTSLVHLASPSPAVSHLMEKVGFSQQLDFDDDFGWSCFGRAHPILNQWEDAWSHN